MITQNLTQEDICTKTGLTAKSFQWIMDRGFASVEAMERLADATSSKLSELLLPDFSGTSENAIEFLKDQKRATVTFSQPRYITRIKKLAEKYPEDCEIVSFNKSTGEGETICAHIPVAWIKINPGLGLTEEQKEVYRKRFYENILRKEQVRSETDLKSI